MPEAAKRISTSSFDKRTDILPFTMFRLSPLLTDETDYEDVSSVFESSCAPPLIPFTFCPALKFWLFASQITGVTELKERAAILIPAETPEEFLLLEEAIAKEMNKFAMAIVVEGGMKAATKVRPEGFFICLVSDESCNTGF